MKALIQKLTRRLGVDIRIIRGVYNEHAQLLTLLRHQRIDLIADVGANVGRFGETLYGMGWQGRMISFEPLADAHRALVRASRGRSGWTVHPRCALGAAPGEARLHVAGNSESSSLLPMEDRHVALAPDSAYVAEEVVAVETLDACLAAPLAQGARLFIKLDAQGFERQVLDGAAESLRQAVGIQIELSTVPLYEGQALWGELTDRLVRLGFGLHGAWPVVIERDTGRLAQFDAMFFRG